MRLLHQFRVCAALALLLRPVEGFFADNRFMGIFYLKALTILAIYVITFPAIDTDAFTHHGIAHILFVAD